jgi:hypothetical protein
LLKLQTRLGWYSWRNHYGYQFSNWWRL